MSAPTTLVIKCRHILLNLPRNSDSDQVVRSHWIKLIKCYRRPGLVSIKERSAPFRIRYAASIPVYSSPLLFPAAVFRGVPFFYIQPFQREIW